MSAPESSYAHIWNGEQQECERCHELTEDIYEDDDLMHVCEGCLNGMDEEDTKEDRWTSHVN